jgi:Peptidase_C39 like family
VLKQTLVVTFAASLAAATLSTSAATATSAPDSSTVAPPVRAQAAGLAGARHVSYRDWATPRALRNGVRSGVRVTDSGARIRGNVRRAGTWTSPWVRPGFALTEAIPSWNATTPRGTWVSVRMRTRTPGGRMSSWDSLGRWASHERRFDRRTFGEQADDLTRVAVDTLRSRGVARLTRWRVRVTLHRRAGTSATPRLHSVGAMASRLPGGNPPTTPTTMRGQRDITVPRRSQMIHRGHYPQWGGGGEAWCSPTSTTMVLGHWDRGPRPRAYRWVGRGHRNPAVDYAARATFDYGYDGAGNWAFNVAYANRYRTSSFVTRLRSLREAERFIRRGIPLVASINFGPGELDGAPISSTAGHLLVIRGFTANGGVIANDPAARRNSGVRRVYKRGQFADAWVGGSGGLVYVIRPQGRALPARTPEANW